MYTTLLTNLDNGIFTITINRPDKMNALNKDVFNDLDAVMDEVNSNAKIKSAIITGAGPKAFVAGADITEFNSLSKDEAMSLSRRGQEVFFKIDSLLREALYKDEISPTNFSILQVLMSLSFSTASLVLSYKLYLF